MQKLGRNNKIVQGLGVFLLLILGVVLAGCGGGTGASTTIGAPPSTPNSSKALVITGNWGQSSFADFQITSKHWTNMAQSTIDAEVSAAKNLGFTGISIATPYDHPEEMQKWVNAARKYGMAIWFRCHWLEWEGDPYGDYQAPRNMSADTYLAKTKQFFLDHKDFFRSGDKVTVCVEAENVGVGAGKPFADWNAYLDFMSKEIDITNDAMRQIGVSGVDPGWLSINGWVAENVLTGEIISKMGNKITLDHYVDQDDSTIVSVDKMADDMSASFDQIHNKWPGAKIIIGEWGYHRIVDTSDEQQRLGMQAGLRVLASKPYIIAFNYWCVMGGHTKIFNDSNGTPTGNRPAADVIKNFLAEAAGGSNPPVPTPDPAPIGTGKMIANFDSGQDGWNGGSIVAGKDNSSGALEIANSPNDSCGSTKQLNGMPIAGANAVEFDINLNGFTIHDSLLGDAAQVAFEQGGLKGANLFRYVKQNGLNGWQHIVIPLSEFADAGDNKLNLNGVLTWISFRFWNDSSGKYTIDNLVLTGGSTTPPGKINGKIIANFDSGQDGWNGGKIVAGFNSSGSLEINNPANDSSGSIKSLNGLIIGDYNTIEMDINTKGTKLLFGNSGDASALYFDQGGWKSVSLSNPKYVNSSINGWQHVSIPLSDFIGLNKNTGLTSIGFRFWNYPAGSYDIDNIILSK